MQMMLKDAMRSDMRLLRPPRALPQSASLEKKIDEYIHRHTK